VAAGVGVSTRKRGILMLLPPLPIDDVLPELQSALAAGPYAVLVAPPGAGKTTRVPIALLGAPWRNDHRIIMLEPRRLAARAAAAQMARLLGEEVGQTIGYRVRMDTRVSAKTRIEIVTEGVFTRMLLDDPELTGIAAVIFDEFHERSLDGDLGLVLTLDAAALRPDLRVLVMSATIDGARVADLLDKAPVIESLGRAFPVETFHREPDPLKRLEDQVTEAVLAALREHEGSALVFLPGQGEITRVAERLAGRVPASTDIAPLYGQLTPSEQDRAIRPAEPGRRKVVLATSIAETSLTIDGVRIVVDSGFRRVPAYEPGTGLTTLETRRVSRAGADQRRGRAGRTSPGVVIRLWNEGQTAALVPFDTPEILAADLAGLALDLANWGVTDPTALPFLDPPPAPAWTEAIALLKSLDVLDASGRITSDGKALARLPCIRASPTWSSRLPPRTMRAPPPSLPSSSASAVWAATAPISPIASTAFAPTVANAPTTPAPSPVAGPTSLAAAAAATCRLAAISPAPIPIASPRPPARAENSASPMAARLASTPPTRSPARRFSS
jgi:ATP-dependent helicase HrpB